MFSAYKKEDTTSLQLTAPQEKCAKWHKISKSKILRSSGA
jgi:hypothetical protein